MLFLGEGTKFYIAKNQNNNPNNPQKHKEVPPPLPKRRHRSNLFENRVQRLTTAVVTACFWKKQEKAFPLGFLY
jgi:hypothetical protein